MGGEWSGGGASGSGGKEDSMHSRARVAATDGRVGARAAVMGQGPELERRRRGIAPPDLLPRTSRTNPVGMAS
uniref:Uncharacterized protein n=1 Tax=Oryza rufipogon TaxID=4529 RepID=A0A0E0PEP0_ORYRU